MRRSCGIQYSLELDGDGVGRSSENGVTVVHTRRRRGVPLRPVVRSVTEDAVKIVVQGPS